MAKRIAVARDPDPAGAAPGGAGLLAETNERVAEIATDAPERRCQPQRLLGEISF